MIRGAQWNEGARDEIARPTFLAASVAVAAPAIDHDRLLAAIAQVEGHATTDLGGRYGFTRIAWEESTRLPWHLSRVPEYADAVARKRLRDLSDRLGSQANAWSLAACWRWGFDGYLARRGERIEYADRVFQLFHSGHRL